ncbi:MAG: hypothetical protein CMO01_18780, partial [Thalassobius sp.]|nr:hypothetical protein [Thalassovita sp.]
MKNFTGYLTSKSKLVDALQNLEELKNDISSATYFIKKIEEGELDIPYPGVDEYDMQENTLSSSLISMRNKLKSLNESDAQRKWIAEGLAFFGDILRNNQTDLSETCNQIIRHLVKYLNANQGTIYIANLKEECLEQKACYAYNRKKYIESKCAFGEGLVGQIYLEKETLVMDDVPENYINITSGLGDALPRAVVIVPLKVNDIVLGIIEIASFKNFLPFHIEFLEKLGESFASTISNIDTNEKTQYLLHQSQIQAEELRSQGEELHQNMEELAATQEEMQRILRESQDKELYMRNLLDAAKDSILTFDKDYKIKHFNKVAHDIYKAYNINLESGVNLLQLYSDEDKDQQKDQMDKALSGESIEILYKSKFNTHHLVNLIPIRNEHGVVEAVAQFSTDITNLVKAQQETEEFLQESRAQEEELQQNMEELSATQEEMQRILRNSQDKELYMRNLLDAAKDSILTFDKEYKIRHFNKVAADLYKAYNIELVSGVDLLMLIDLENRDAQKEQMDKALAGEAIETLYDGEGNHFLTNLIPLKDELGNVEAVAQFSTDVTQLVKAQQETEEFLQESRAQEEELMQNMEELSATQEEMQRVLKNAQDKELYMRNMLDASRDSIVTFDQEYKVKHFNKVARDIYEVYDIELKIGFDLLQLIPDEEREEQKTIMDKALAGESIETLYHSQYDTHHQVCFVPIKDKDGN